MTFHRIAAGLIGLCVWSLGVSLHADLIIEETFTGYLDNVLISASPAGPALGLTGDWTLVPDSDFYVNKTRYDDDAGTGKAVYNRPPGDNGTRTTTRSTSADHVLFENDGDVFYASFLIDPARASGDMTFELGLRRLDGGGTTDLSFGIVGGQYILGNGGDDVNVGDGTVTADEQLVVIRIEYGAADTGPDADEVVTLWVDPVDELSAPVIDGVETNMLNRGGGKITAISMLGGKMNGSPAFFDNLRVGASFAAVNPEPIPGDANRDGCVDETDAMALATHWGQGGAWPQGDFDNDAFVGPADASILAAHWGCGTGEATAVPEPSAMALLGIGALGLLARMWRRRP